MKLSNDPGAGRVAVGLFLAGIVLFGASLNDPFHYDDVLITNDANVTNPSRWTHFLNPLHLRQLTFFSFYLNHLIGGQDAMLFHAVNVLLHVGSAILLFLLLARFVERWAAVAAAAVFLVHPVQTEPVLYIYQRSTLLACFFSLLGLIALAEKRTWLAVVFFVFAFEGKESAVAVPLAVALLYRGRQSSGIDRRYSVGLFLAALILAAATVGLLFYQGESTVGIGAADEIGPARYFLAQTRIFYTYLRLLFFPYPQSLEYEFPPTVGILPSIGIVILLGIALWMSRNPRWRLPGLCMIAFILLLAPTSSIVPSTDPAFEHRLYLPMLAFSTLAALLLAKIPRRTEITAAVLVVFSVVTVYRGTVWANDIALWEDTAKRAPGKSRVWFNLGGAYLNSDPDRARAALRRAVELQPNFVEAIYDLGILEQREGNWPAALAFYERAAMHDPGYWPAWNNMGNALFAMGQAQRAVESFEKTLSLNRDYWPAQYNIAIAQFMNGRYEEAVRRLEVVLDWRPQFREARYLMAVSLTRAGHREKAEEQWQKLGEVTAAESRATPTMILAPNRP
jgi:tetratricopeptide (TPR) repeat protein